MELDRPSRLTERDAAPARTALAIAWIVSAALALPGCSDRTAPRSTLRDSAEGNPAQAPAPVATEEVVRAIGTRLHGGADSPHGAPDAEQADLAALYPAGSEELFWIDEGGRPGARAAEALQLLGEARSEGLEPADYDAGELEQLADDLRSAPAAQGLARFEVGLSRAMLRYLRHLHLGRIDPLTIGFRLKVPAEGHDFAALLRAACARDRLQETIAELRPARVQYDELRRMLARYRSLAADEALVPPAAPDGAVRPGEPYAGLDALHRLLTALGDLPAGTPMPAPPVDDGAFVEAVRRFQVRHGLEPDGIVGRRTSAALRVPLAWRVRQIELALERLRWLPDPDGLRVIAINIPMFRLWAWEPGQGSLAPALGMGVVVGRALDTQTPVFVEELREVVFRPYWNVPRSILRGEILPQLAREPGYLDDQNMEVIGWGAGDRPVALTPETLAELRRGTLRVRQRPGPGNALGLVKFVFPNDLHVYMHATPEKELFDRYRRDFSHGCVRVEKPVDLAEWVLGPRPEWTRDRIRSAMEGPGPTRVQVESPVRVLLFYTTAAVVPEDGRIHFADDIYRHDTRLDEALTALANAS